MRMYSFYGALRGLDLKALKLSQQNRFQGFTLKETILSGPFITPVMHPDSEGAKQPGATRGNTPVLSPVFGRLPQNTCWPYLCPGA
jgi:hypothetical protein